MAGNFLFAPTSAGLVAADVTTGQSVWTGKEVRTGVSLNAASGVALGGGSVYVVTSDGRFIGFSR